LRGELAAVGQLLRQRCEIGLGLRQVAGLKVLAKLLELRLELLKAVLGLLNNGILEKAARDDSGDGHFEASRS
jgi:hypothetical protein